MRPSFAVAAARHPSGGAAPMLSARRRLDGRSPALRRGRVAGLLVWYFLRQPSNDRHKRQTHRRNCKKDVAIASKIAGCAAGLEEDISVCTGDPARVQLPFVI